MSIDKTNLQDFLNLSVELTAFSEVELRGTGYSEKYYQTILDVIGETIFKELLNAYRNLSEAAGKDWPKKEQLLRQDLLSSRKLGPITRNIIKIWYVATWYPLPPYWRDEFGSRPNDGTFVVDAWAYPEGLLWPAVGAHPPGAKPFGYGSWTEKPADPKIIATFPKI